MKPGAIIEVSRAVKLYSVIEHFGTVNRRGSYIPLLQTSASYQELVILAAEFFVTQHTITWLQKQ